MRQGFVSPLLLTIFIIIVGAVSAIGGYFIFAKKTPKKIQVNQVTTVPKINNTTPQITPVTQSQTENPEITFADKLNSCTKFKTSFKHILTGEVLDKEIVGIINGKCDYVEQMPNKGKMECKYTENERIVVAQYYKNMATSASVETNLKSNLANGQQETKYLIDGNEVANPLQEMMDKGICVISGY